MTKPPMITAAILAGQRPGIDPFAAEYAQTYKALVPVAGRPMVAYALHTLVTHPRIGKVLLLGQDGQAILDGLKDTRLAGNTKITIMDGPNSISKAVAAAVVATNGPLLLTTADHVLLSHAMIDAMLESASSDVTVAMVERKVLLARYPQSKRTWLKFRGGWWSGANLFWLDGGVKLMRLLEFWQGIEADRKKGWRILSAFGPLLALGALLRLWSIEEAVKKAGKRFGLNAVIAAMPQAEACIDVDKPSDKALVEQILAARLSDPNH
jgi:GTP:adenosylcobinamide-phosphate guanylyltransferase